MPSWFQLYSYRSQQLKRFQLPEGSEGADSSTTYLFHYSLLVRWWFWWKMFILVIDLYYINECCLWMSFKHFYSYSIHQLLPLNVILMALLLLHLVFKIMMTPALPTSLFELLGSKSKKLLKLEFILRYDFNGLNMLIYVIFLVSYFLPYTEAAWMHLVYTFKLIEVNSYLAIIHTKIHTYKFLRVIYRLSMLMFLILYLSHLFGSIFYFLDQSLINQKYFGNPSTNPSNYYQFNAASYTPIEMLSDYGRYIMAFYFSNGLVTTIAYGDIVGQNWIQDVYVAILMVVSTVMVAFLLEEFMIMVEDNRFAIYDIMYEGCYGRRNYRHLKQLMQEKRVPEGLQLRIRNFIFYSEHYNKFRNPATILGKLTNKMKVDLFYKGYGKHLELVFEPLGFSKIKVLCQHLQQITFQPEIDLFLPEWKQSKQYTRECTCENEVNRPNFMFLNKGTIEQYVQWEEKSKEFVLREGNPYLNTFQFFTQTHVRYGARTKTIVQFIRITREAFDGILAEYPKFKAQLALLKEQVLCNSASRKHFLDVCEVCEAEDHSVINCPEVHYVVDEGVERGEKIEYCLDGLNCKRGKKERKVLRNKKIIGIGHYSALFANLSLEAMFEGPGAVGQSKLDMRASYLDKTIKHLFQKINLPEHDHQDHEAVCDSVYDPSSLDQRYRIQYG